jgi:hypothetical protein
MGVTQAAIRVPGLENDNCNGKLTMCLKLPSTFLLLQLTGDWQSNNMATSINGS